MALIWANGTLTTTAFESGTNFVLPRRRSLSLIAGPASNFVTLSDIKEHVRVEASVTDDDLVLSTLVFAAQVQIERWTRRSFQQQTWALQIDGPVEDVVELPMATPLVSVSFITTTDDDGVGTTFSSGSYFTDSVSVPGRVFLKDGVTWPTRRDTAGWICQYITGYATPAAAPAGLSQRFQQAIKLLVGHWYENREAAMDTPLEEIPYGVKALIDGFKIPRI